MSQLTHPLIVNDPGLSNLSSLSLEWSLEPLSFSLYLEREIGVYWYLFSNHYAVGISYRTQFRQD